MPRMPRWIQAAALSVGLVAIASSVPVVPALRCSMVAWANEVRQLGRDGQDGMDGRDGRTGRSGRDRTVSATGSPVNLNLSGERGTTGEDGQDARRPYCESQPRSSRYDIRMADGGDGGEGGDGGDGGRGGNVTVYYQDPNALRQIYVQAAGGEGGSSGRGGRGTNGCQCRRQRWTVEVCTDGTCREESFTCRDGRDGVDGRDGRRGESGATGRLTLIGQLEPPLPDQPTQTVRLDNAGRTISLSRNLWRTRYGAAAMLAPGSVIADEYEEFAGRVEKQVRLVWESEQPMSAYTNQAATVELDQDEQISVNFNQDLWVDARTMEQGDVTEVAIANVVRREEATQLDIADVSGSSQDLTFAVVDLARKSDIVNTQFEIAYRVGQGGRRRPSRYRTRYEGTVPAAQVTQEFNRFVIDVGRLPIDASDLIPGTYVEIEVTAVRSLGSNTAEQTLRWQGRLER